MSRNRFVLGLIVAIAVATSAVVTGSSLGKAQNHTDRDRSRGRQDQAAHHPQSRPQGSG